MTQRFTRRQAVKTGLIVAGGAATLSPFVVKGAEALAGASTYTSPASNRVDTIIDTGWKFHEGDVSGAQTPSFDDSGWGGVTLPHTWNNLDDQHGGNSYYRSIGWYRLHYTVPTAAAGREIFLQFDSAKLVADVYVNGTHLGQHIGGYATFRFDATAALIVGGDNVIAVQVNNAYNANIPPLSADFPIFGGLDRDAHIVVTDKLHIRMNDFGASGVYLKPTNVSASTATLQITTKTYNNYSSAQAATLKAVIVDASNTIVQTLTATANIPAGSEYDFAQSTTISNPHLWNGRGDPYLYHVYVQLQIGTTVTDVVAQPLGFRSFAVDPNTGFTLNGHAYDLHGFSMMEDRPNQGDAVTNAQIDQDFALAQDVGATFIRLSHFQRQQHAYDNADAAGFVIWAELSLIANVTASAAFTANAEQQMTELIRQNYNHPSIIFWGLGNEVNPPPDPTPLLNALNMLAHTEDPTRLTTLPDDSGPGDATSTITDVLGYNRYLGWYSGNENDLNGFLNSVHQNYPTRAIGLSEYGAGGSIYQHQDNPPQTNQGSYFHPEEYQSQLHEIQWQAAASKPWLWVKCLWNFFDFASDGRNEGDHIGLNDKGLLTYDRQTKKDVYYWYRANWSSIPFVYITDRRYTNRTLPTTNIKIYANTASVTLTVNGVSQGSKTSANHIFLWTGVTLQAGSNTIQATSAQGGNTYTDSATWLYNPSTRLSSGARLPYTDTAGKFYDVDHYYSGGSTGATAATIAGTPEQGEYQTYRVGNSSGSGAFSYSVPVVNGTCTLYLKFVEPSKTGTGQRVFSVGVNGTTVINNLDIFARVGQNAALEESFPVTITAGTLNLTFTPSVDNAIISAFALVHA